MDAVPNKRKAGPDQRDRGSNKRSKGKKKWNMPRKEGAGARGIQPGDVGIWVTCALNKEAPSVSDLRDLFEKYALQLYGEDQAVGAAEHEGSEGSDVDIEDEIKKEIEGIKKPKADPLFKNVRLTGTCMLFFKTRLPIEPVSFVHRICRDTADGVEHQRCRYVKRLTPLTAIDKVTERGLEDVARQVIAPHFHAPDQESKKFAIRVNIRNNKEISRDEVIKKVAAIVGKGHKVDLSRFDLLILVEIYQSIVGMSVVGSDYEKLKRYNLAELRDVTIKIHEKGSDPNTTAKEEDPKE